jgi:hypothetical protein
MVDTERKTYRYIITALCNVRIAVAVSKVTKHATSIYSGKILLIYAPTMAPNIVRGSIARIKFQSTKGLHWTHLNSRRISVKISCFTGWLLDAFAKCWSMYWQLHRQVLPHLTKESPISHQTSWLKWTMGPGFHLHRYHLLQRWLAQALLTLGLHKTQACGDYELITWTDCLYLIRRCCPSETGLCGGDRACRQTLPKPAAYAIDDVKNAISTQVFDFC